MAENFTPLFPI